MKVAVIGAGKIGGTVGGKWAAAGHEVAYGMRDPSRKKGGKTIEEALDAEVVLLALPGSAVVELVREHSRQLDHKTIIDATNNFQGTSANSWSAIAPMVPNATLYRAFNSLGWELFDNPVVGGTQADLFYAGPEGDGRQKVEHLIADAGLRPIWVGGADHADTIDGVLRLWFTLTRSRGRRIAFKLIAD